MSKDKIIKLLEGCLSLLKRVILFLPSLIGLINSENSKSNQDTNKTN